MTYITITIESQLINSLLCLNVKVQTMCPILLDTGLLKTATLYKINQN